MKHNTRRQNGIFTRDSLWLGLLIGACLPIAAYGILLTLADTLDNHALPPDISISRGFRDRTLSVIAICANLLPLHRFKSNYCDNSMRGIVFPTIAFVIAWVWMFGRQLIGL